MINKKLTICLSLCTLIVITGVVLFLIFANKNSDKAEQNAASKTNAETKAYSDNTKQSTVEQGKSQENEIDMAENDYSDIPLISISDIKKISPEAKKSLDTVMNTANKVYFFRYNPRTKEIFILYQRPVQQENKFERHDFAYAKVTNSGDTSYFNPAYNGEENETDNVVNQASDVWEFDETTEPPRPLKHTAFNKKGKIEFVETWNYSDSEPVKYEMKTAKGVPVSIIKETQNGDSEYRKENVIYDKNGKTAMSFSVNYEDANIKRISYYDSNSPENSIVIENDYTDGLKSGEKVYNGNFELIEDLKTNDCENKNSSTSAEEQELFVNSEE